MRVRGAKRQAERALTLDAGVFNVLKHFARRRDKQYDSAVKVMMEHYQAFDHDSFMEIIVQCRNVDLAYKAIAFYFEHEPKLLTKMLLGVSASLDHTRAVRILKSAGDDALLLAVEYLKSVQSNDK